MRVPVPDANVLIHAGDFCARGDVDEFQSFAAWLKELPHANKIVVPGNHDWFAQREPEMAKSMIRNAGGVLLIDEQTIVNGYRFYGSPWQPAFCNWAFNLPRGGQKLTEKWAMIPFNVDVLITHGPRRRVCDYVHSEYVGCGRLAERFRSLRPELHVCGHIHAAYGTHRDNNGCLTVNASICTERYSPTNAPVVVDLARDLPLGHRAILV